MDVCRFTVKAEHHGKTLLEFLALMLPGYSDRLLERLVREERILVEGIPKKPEWPLLRGLEIRVALPSDLVPEPSSKSCPFMLLADEEAYLAVNKPAGLNIDACGSKGIRHTLLQRLREHLGTEALHPVRPTALQRDETGVVLFARDSVVAQDIDNQYYQGGFGRTYQVLLEGLPPEREDVIELLVEDPAGLGQEGGVAPERGHLPWTRYRVREVFDGYTLVSAESSEDSTEVMRSHFHALGHPLALDPVRGRRQPFLLSSFKPDYRKKSSRGERPLLARSPIHLETVTFQSPVTGKRVRLEAPFPKDFRGLLRALRRYRTPLPEGLAAL